MKKNKFITALIFIFLSCAQLLNAQTNYTENKEITSLIKKKRTYNKYNETGWRIQLYNGLEKKAKSTERRFKIHFPGIYTKLSYKNPEWKIQVGNYKTKLHADRALNKFREKFDGAIVVPL